MPTKTKIIVLFRKFVTFDREFNDAVGTGGYLMINDKLTVDQFGWPRKE